MLPEFLERQFRLAGGVTTFSIPGSLRVAMGDGNDSVGIVGDVGGLIVVRLGPADLGNGIVIGSEVSASRVGGGVTVNGDDRCDCLHGGREHGRCLTCR